MGRPVITRAVKRSRHYLAGREDYGAAGLESIAVEVAHDLIEAGVRKLAAKVRKRKAKRKAKKITKAAEDAQVAASNSGEE